jgi:lipopolysaccharide export system permease protein
MFKHIDWLMIKGYFKAYAVCLISLLTLYVVVDLFTNLDDFLSHNAQGLDAVAVRIASYYGFRIPQFFDRLCEAIVLLAAMFTVALMQRHNEQIPLLSAGVSTQRIVLPVLICAFVMMFLSVLNQELVIPGVGDRMTRDRSDPAGQKEMTVHGAFESNLIHIHGDRATRHKMVVKKFYCTIPENVTESGTLIHITAREARYHPSGEPHKGRWELLGCEERDVPNIPGVLEATDAGRYFLHTRSVDFDALTRDQRWYLLAPTWLLYRELQRPESTRLAAMAVLFHTRLTRPLLGMVLVLLGLSVILRDQNRNVFISSGQCLVLCGLFFAATYACKMLGDNEYLNPALAAWLPVIVFGPFAVAMFDAVHT